MRFVHTCAILLSGTLLLALVRCSGQVVSQPSPMPMPPERAIPPTVLLPTTVPELILLLYDDGASVRIEAAYALGRMGAAATPAIPGLVHNLSYPYTSEVRQAAAKALGNMGSAAQPAVHPLIDMIKFQHFAGERITAIEVIANIGDSSVMPDLAPFLYEQSINGFPYDVAAHTARTMGLLAKQDFPDLHGSGFSLEADGTPIIVKAAQRWWEQKGQFMDWSQP